MNLKHFKMFSDKGFQDVNDACSSEKMYMNSHEKFQERLRKTLYYGNFADATLPSPIVTDVAVRLINAKTNSKKSLDKHQAARITRRARISPCALMMGILYTERLAQTNPNYLKKVSSSDLFMVSMKIYAETHVQLHKVASLNLCVNPGLTCFEQPAPGVVNLSGIKESYNVLVASKYLYDDGEDEDAYNYDWCKAGNYHIRDLNRLEREFLNSIEWKVFVSCKEFFDFVNKVETRVALDQSDERGWFTYLDMSTILENSIFQDFFTKYLKSTGKTILGCTLAYSLSLVLLLSFPVYLSNKEHVVCQDAHSVVGKSIPSMSFTGQLGYSEYSLKISQSVRKRQMILGNSSDFKQQSYWSTLKLNETKPNNGGYTEDICEHCRSNRMTLDSKGSFLANWFSSTTGECSGQTCGSIVNDTIDAQKLVTNFKQILSFMTLAFYTRSSVRFPVWENRYSDIWIGFSTSCASAAA